MVFICLLRALVCVSVLVLGPPDLRVCCKLHDLLFREVVRLQVDLRKNLVLIAALLAEADGEHVVRVDVKLKTDSDLTCRLRCQVLYLQLLDQIAILG